MPKSFEDLVMEEQLGLTELPFSVQFYDKRRQVTWAVLGN